MFLFFYLGNHTLSVRRSSSHERASVKHYRISCIENGWVYISPGLTFRTLSDLVAHYSGIYIHTHTHSQIQLVKKKNAVNRVILQLTNFMLYPVAVVKDHWCIIRNQTKKVDYVVRCYVNSTGNHPKLISNHTVTC